jgi:hypothetical protein
MEPRLEPRVESRLEYRLVKLVASVFNLDNPGDVSSGDSQVLYILDTDIFPRSRTQNTIA